MACMAVMGILMEATSIPVESKMEGKYKATTKEVDHEVDAESQIQIPNVMHDNEQIWWGSYSTC